MQECRSLVAWPDCPSRDHDEKNITVLDYHCLGTVKVWKKSQNDTQTTNLSPEHTQ